MSDYSMKVKVRAKEKETSLIPIRPVDQYRTALGHHLKG
jgi:hypothetical protein